MFSINLFQKRFNIASVVCYYFWKIGRLLKAKEKTEASSVVREIEKGCCKRKCIGDIPVRYVTKKREEFWLKTIQERNEVITNAIASRSDGRLQLNDVSETICAKAWCTVHGFSISR